MAVKDRLAGVPVLGTALEVQERYTRDAADQLAAAIGFFAFLSLFPLMILAVSAAGFVLSDPAEQVRIAELVTEAIPGFEATLGDDETGVAQLVSNVVDNRGAIGLVGLVTLVLTGLRVVNSAMAATTVVFRAAVPSGVGAKLRQLAVMVALGILALAAVSASSLAGVPADVLPGWAAVGLALGVSFVLDTLLFAASYRLLRGDALVRARDLLPGALLAAVGWTALKVAGASYVSSQMDDANALYGALGGVIALLLLLYLAGRLYLYGAELSAVLLERRAGPLEDLGEPVASAPAADGGPDAQDAADGTAAGGDGGAGSPRPATAAVGAAAPATGAAAGDPGARRLGPEIGSPAVGQRTRMRMAAADAARVQPPPEDPDHGRAGDRRAAAGFALGALALAAAWRFLREE